MPSIMDMFRSTPAAAPVAAPAAPAKNGEVAPTTVGDPNAQPPGVVATGADQPKKETSPLDAFSTLWEPKPVDPKAPAKFDPANIFKLDPKQVAEKVSAINFAPQLTPEQTQAIMAGGEGAVKAMTELVNKSTQAAFGQMLQVSAKMIEQGHTQSQATLDTAVNDTVRRNAVNSALIEANPALNHPAAAPLLAGLKQQLLEKNPTASPAEISQQAQTFLANFAAVAAGKKPETSDSKPGSASEDWGDYLTD